MSILNVNTLQPVGSGQTITVSAANITASSATITAGGFTGNLTGNVTGNVTGTVNSSGIATFSNGVVVAAGTTAAPSISPTGDSNTGIFFPSADTIAFTEGGVEALRVDSSGHIGIANSSPKSWGTNIPTIEIKGTATSGGNSTRSGAIAFESGSGSNGYAVLWGQSGGIEIYTGATDRASATYRAKFDSTGNLAFASGNGIDFSATSDAAGMTSELLNDYEEGTWTPTVGGTSTYNTQVAHYRKVGKVVYITAHMHINAIGTGLGYRISGLPYVAISGGPEGGGVIHYWTGFTTTAIQPVLGVNSGGSSVELYARNVAASASSSPGTLLGDGSRVYFSAFYFTS